MTAIRLLLSVYRASHIAKRGIFAYGSFYSLPIMISCDLRNKFLTKKQRHNRGVSVFIWKCYAMVASLIKSSYLLPVFSF